MKRLVKKLGKRNFTILLLAVLAIIAGTLHLIKKEIARERAKVARAKKEAAKARLAEESRQAGALDTQRLDGEGNDPSDLPKPAKKEPDLKQRAEAIRARMILADKPSKTSRPRKAAAPQGEALRELKLNNCLDDVLQGNESYLRLNSTGSRTLPEQVEEDAQKILESGFNRCDWLYGNPRHPSNWH